MIYDTNKNILLNSTPKSINLNGTIITGPITDIDLLAEAGYYTVRSDEPKQQENSIEDISQRKVFLNKPYVDITRVWIDIVPEVISARQIRLWLIDNNIELDSIEAVIEGIEDKNLRERTFIEWEYSPYIRRNHPLLEILGEALGLNAKQVDDAFIQANNL
jgi:hypothetical protein